jgi:hypothetical protein
MKSKVSGFPTLFNNRQKDAAPGTILEAVDFYQSSCWHCGYLWGPSNSPETANVQQRPDGMFCLVCNKLNAYK